MAGAQGNGWRAAQAARLRPQAHAHFTNSGHPVVDRLFRTGERIMMGDQAHEIRSRTAWMFFSIAPTRRRRTTD